MLQHNIQQIFSFPALFKKDPHTSCIQRQSVDGWKKRQLFQWLSHPSIQDVQRCLVVGWGARLGQVKIYRSRSWQKSSLHINALEMRVISFALIWLHPSIQYAILVNREHLGEI